MQKKVTDDYARNNLGEVMDDVSLRGDNVVIEREGEPVAAVIPMALYENLHARREEFWRQVEAIRERVAEVDEKVLDQAIAEAVDHARQK
jgi:prevent-host-death family protein